MEDHNSDMAGLEAAYLAAQQAAVVEIADQGLISLTQLVDSGAIDVAPSFQRRDRWGTEAQSLLIESFLMNIPVPPVYLAEDEGSIGSYAVIDGKQRLTAISAFFGGRLTLKGLVSLPQLNGRRYEDLPIGLRRALGMKNLRVTTLMRQSDEGLKHEVFLRLNTGGEVLNAQEIRNVAYRGPLNDLVYALAENPFLRSQFKIVAPASAPYRNMTDAEYVIRFLTLSVVWRKFRGDIRTELDLFMQRNRFRDNPWLHNTHSKFISCIGAAEAIWGRDAFHRPGRDQALTGLYDAQMIALAELSQAQLDAVVSQADKVRVHSARLFDRPDFDQAVRQATNTPARLRLRVEAMASVLNAVSGVQA